MKRILFLIPTLSGGGAERVLLNLLKYLQNDKYEIEVVTIFKDEMPSFLSPIRYRYIFPRKFRGNVHLFKLLNPKQLFRLFVGNPDNYDLVISYLHSPTMRIAAGAAGHKPKLINWIHNEFSSKKELSRLFRNDKEFDRCMRSYDRTVFVADSARISTIKLLPFLEECSLTIYNTVESDVIRQKSLEPLEDESFKDDTFNIISVGRFAKAKAFDRLLRITAKLAEQGIKVHLHLLGEGSLKKEYEREIEQLGIGELVTFPGFVDNPYKYVKHADLFVCSSLHEGFSTAVTESLILGTPVITTFCSGMEELLGKNNQYGVITYNDEKLLMTEVLKYASHPELLQELRKKAVIRGDMFSREKTVSDVINLFDNILERKND